DLRWPRRRGLPRRDAVGARAFARARAKPRGSARVRTPRPPGARREFVAHAEPRALPEAEAAEAGIRLARAARRPSRLPLALVCGARSKLIHEVDADYLMSLIAPASPPGGPGRQPLT